VKWHKRLFVKIFVAIWGASALVLLGTLLVFTTVAEEELLKVKVEGFAQRVADRYETEGISFLQPDRGPRGPRPPRGEPRGEARGEARAEQGPRPRPFPTLPAEIMSISDVGADRVIIRQPKSRLEEVDVSTLIFTSDSGAQYSLVYHKQLEGLRGERLLGLLISAQVWFVLCASALAAYLLTWIIVRPINALRQHTKALYEGDLECRAEYTLVARGDEIGELAREFDRMADYVQSTLGSNQRLLQDVSHELRAPLARLQASVGLAEQKLGIDDPCVARINRECVRIDRLISEILTYSRLDREATSNDLFNANELVSAMVEDIRFNHIDRPINVSLCEQSIALVGSEALFERAIGNVLSNAVKYTDEHVQIDVTSQLSGGVYTITIRDHGFGVSEKELAQLFEPFYRGRSECEGYGLGLSIVQRATQCLGGDVTIENHPQSGLLVTYTFKVSS